MITSFKQIVAKLTNCKYLAFNVYFNYFVILMCLLYYLAIRSFTISVISSLAEFLQARWSAFLPWLSLSLGSIRIISKFKLESHSLAMSYTCSLIQKYFSYHRLVVQSSKVEGCVLQNMVIIKKDHHLYAPGIADVVFNCVKYITFRWKSCQPISHHLQISWLDCLIIIKYKGWFTIRHNALCCVDFQNANLKS